MLLVNVPLGIVAAIATKRMLVESRASGRRRMPDLRGALLLAVTLGLVTLGLVKGPDWGWLSVATVGSFLASVLTSVGFVHSSRSHPAPLVEPALLRSRSFVAGNLLTLVAAAGFYCYGLTHVLYLNYVWHYSLLKAGFAIAPAAVVAAVVAAALGRVAGRHGHRVIVLVGALVWAGSLVWYLQRVGSEPDFLRVWLPGQLLQGIGVGATLPVLSSAALAEVAKGGSYATSSAVVSTTRQLGAVLGVAVMVILIGKPEHGTAEEALRRGWAMAAICFIAVAVAAAVLGRTNRNPVQMPAPEPAIAPRLEPPIPQPAAAPIEHWAAGDADPLGNLPLFAGLDAATLAQLGEHVEDVELEAGCYLFHEGDPSDSLYVIRTGRVQVLQDSIVLKELGRGEVLGELGLLIDAPRSATVRALRELITPRSAVIAVFGACGMDAATADAYAYEYFIRHNPLSDYAFPVRGLVRGRRTLTLLEAAFGDRLVEELPKEFRCVSVDLLARRPVVHRRGRLVDVIGCSLRLPGIYPPQVYNGRLHVDGGVLDNLPVSTRASPDGPLIAVSIGLGGGGPGSARQDGSPKVPGIGDTLMRTMTIGSQRGADAALSLAQVVIRPDTGAVGLLEFHQIDAAREAGRVAAREAMPHIMALLNR